MKIIFERPALSLFKSRPRWYNTHNRNFADKEAFPMKSLFSVPTPVSSPAPASTSRRGRRCSSPPTWTSRSLWPCWWTSAINARPKGRGGLELPASAEAPRPSPQPDHSFQSGGLRAGPLAALCGHHSLPHLSALRGPGRPEGHRPGEAGQEPAGQVPRHQALPRPDREQVPVVYCRCPR